jgi:hypothetical protein
MLKTKIIQGADLSFSVACRLRYCTAEKVQRALLAQRLLLPLGPHKYFEVLGEFLASVVNLVQV